MDAAKAQALIAISAIWFVIMGIVATTQPGQAHSPSPVGKGETAAVIGAVMAPAPPARNRASRPMAFDWRANRPDPALQAARPSRNALRAPGHGSYICSAAGFGTMSRCTER